MRPAKEKPVPVSIVAVGDDGAPTREVAWGQALVVRAEGLRPSTRYELQLRDEAGPVLAEATMSDRHGRIRDLVLWPQVGLDDPRTKQPGSVERSRAAWKGRSAAVSLLLGDKAVAAVKVGVVTGLPLAVATDGKGVPRAGFEIGAGDAVLTLVGYPKGADIRLWMVPRQHEWRIGDRIRPTPLANGRPAQVDARVTGEVQRVTVAKAATLRPGVYDFVVRAVRYGYEDDDDLVIRRGDVITSRWTSGLVIRERFMESKVIGGGCANLQQIACRRTLGGMWPYAQYTDTFQVGEDVWGALDPNALDPAHAGKAAAIYIVPHKDAVGWTADNSLAHLPVLGGNAATQKWVTQTWCVNANLHLLWPAAAQVGDYDIVVDFGNNVPDLASFAQDDAFDMPLDMIDGYVLPGFRIVADPGVDTSFTHVGGFSYDSSTQGTVTPPTWGSPIPLNANVRFPADAAGATTPGQISASQPNYPVVMLVHGNSSHINSYQGYDYLLDHLARNGFIAVSIHMAPGQNGEDRARVIQAHLPIVFGMFGTRAANNVGLMGHSRGGEAVVCASRLNTQEGWGWDINAVISLAPTNQHTFEFFSGAWACPYLVIYGSLDGDLGGIGNTGFELYDHASGMNKSMAFVYRACHDRFNTVWGDGDFYFGQLTPGDIATVLSANSHELISKAYMTGFFRQHMKGHSQFEGIFRGEWVPASVAASDPDMRIFTQYEDTVARTVDDFEGPHNPTSWQTSTLGGAVSQSALTGNPQENDLRTMDPRSPHLTAGLNLDWNSLAGRLDIAIPAGQRDVSGFTAVSFRVSQRVGSGLNPVGQAQDLRLTLADGGGHSRAIRVSKLDEIPFPHERGYSYLTKSAMCTIRIPLAAYHIHCLNVDQVDLADVVSLSFEFGEKPSGAIAIDSIQFTN